MGKASSAKKVARVARAGGRVSGVRQRNLLFPGAIAAIFVLGGGLVGLSWNDHRDKASSEPPVANVDHWHTAFGFYACDSFLPNPQTFESKIGIHTHADGVVHIHPFSDAGGGDNATLGAFLDGLKPQGITLTDDELKVGDQTWKNGETKCGDKEGELVVARWQDVQNTDNKPTIFTDDFDDLRFREDGEGITIAFVPEGETDDIPKPPSAADLAALGAADKGDPTGSSTTGPETTGSTEAPATDPNATTVPPDPNAATTVPTETTAPPAGG
jgi:hypothetical protein